MRNARIGLLVAAYMWVLYTSLAAAYARAHTELGPTIPAEYSAPWSVALGLRPCTQRPYIGAHSHPPRRKVGDLAFRRNSAHSSGRAYRHRPALLGDARSTSARMPRFHNLYGSRLGRPRVGLTWPFPARSICRLTPSTLFFLGVVAMPTTRE
jgi:hypothetical protein